MQRLRSIIAKLRSSLAPRALKRRGTFFFVWMFEPKKLLWRIPLVGLCLLLVITIIARLAPSDSTGTQGDPLRQVSLLSLADDDGAAGPLSLVGEVSALQKAELRAESGGRVTSVQHKIGDRVSAGTVIATFENARERSALLSAEGTLESAQAALSRVESGSRSETLDILSASAENARTSLETTQESVVNALKNVYIVNDDAVHAKLDSVFSNPRTSAPQFTLVTSDSRLEGEIEAMRPQIESILAAEAVRKDRLSSAIDLDAELALAQDETRRILTFADAVLRAVNRAIPSTAIPQSTIATLAGSVSGAQAAVNGNLQSISGSSQELSGKTTALRVAEANLSQGETPARTEDTLQAQAGLKQAQGAYGLALANYEKTLVRSPIFGTINSLAADLGSYVAPGTLVASIANASGIEIKTNITIEDMGSIVPGAEVETDGGLRGAVTRVSPGVDPVTKNVEVLVAIEDPEKTLIDGTSIGLSIARKTNTAGETSRRERSLPLSSVKLYADKAVVFTVDSASGTSRLFAHPIELGPLLGDRVIVRGGLDDLTSIVKDARGLRDGQSVEVK